MPPLPRFTPEELTGRATSHVAPLEGFPLLLLHREVAGPFLAMRAAAAWATAGQLAYEPVRR